MGPLDAIKTHVNHPFALRRMWGGASCVVQGTLLTLRTPALLQLAVVPVAINLAAYPVMLWAAWRVLFPAHDALYPWADPGGAWTLLWHLGSWALYLLLAAALALVALLLVTVVASVVAAPFLERITAKAELVFTNTPAPEGPGPVQGALRAIGSQLGFMALYLPLLAAGTLLSAVPVVGWVVGPLVHLVVAMMLMPVQHTEWAAERRHLGLGSRLQFLRAHRASCLGFGVAAWVMMWFPFTMPFVAVGGTVLFLALENAPLRADRTG